MTNDDIDTATVHRGAPDWHGGDGWYWIDDEYPEDAGMVGAFVTAHEAAEHARIAGYQVKMPPLVGGPTWKPQRLYVTTARMIAWAWKAHNAPLSAR